MLALGSLSSVGAFEDIAAMIKGRVGKFLQQESILRRLEKSPSVTTRSEAAGLLATHVGLESELGEVQKKLDAFQTGSWSFTDVIDLGDFSTRFISHMNEVDRFERRTAGIKEPGIGMTWMMPAVGLAVAGSILYFVLGKK